jgi:signal transduction histidine kinase
MANQPQISISRILHNNRSEILTTWESEVRRLPAMRDLPRLVLINHVPALLDRIITIAEAARLKVPAAPPETIARVHAANRLEAGVDLRQVVTEFAVLRRTILTVLLRETAPRQHDGALTALNQAVDDAVGASVEEYVGGRERTLQALDEVAAATYENPDLDTLLSRLLDAFLGVDGNLDLACILLREGDALVVRAIRGVPDEAVAGSRVSPSGGFIEAILAGRRPRTVSHAAVDPALGNGFVRHLRARALFGAPFVDRGEVIGLALVGSGRADTLDDLDVHVLTAVAGRATDALVQHRLLEDLRAALAATEVERRRFLDLVDNLDDSVVWEAEPRSLRFSFVSSRAERVTGVPAERWTETLWLDHVPAGDLERLRKALDNCCLTGGEDRVAHRFVRPDGRTMWLQTGLHLAGTGGQSQIRGVSVDVTRLVQTLESRDEYLSYISHDVRNPLAGISLHATVLGKTSLAEPEGERVRQIAEKISRAAEQVTMAFTNTRPLSISSAKRSRSAASFVHTLAPRPKRVSLASRMAASGSGARNSMATGPKSSSRYAGLSPGTSVRTVGA